MDKLDAPQAEDKHCQRTEEDRQDAGFLELERRIARHRFFKKHGIIFGTSVMRLNYASVRGLVLTGEGGCWLEDPSGSAKSALSLYSQQRLLDQLQTASTAVIWVSIRNIEEGDILTFMHDLLLSLGVDRMRIPKRGRGLFDACNARLHALAAKSDDRQVILIIDESHRLGVRHYMNMKDLGNNLEAEGLDLRVAQFGEGPALGRFIAEMKNDEGSASIVNRYARNKVPMRNYAIEDLKEAFELIDDEQRTELNGATVVEDLLPEWKQQGFRLSNYAASVWNTFALEQLTGGQVFRTAKAMVRLLMFEGQVDLSVADQIAKDAVRLSYGME